MDDGTVQQILINLVGSTVVVRNGSAIVNSSTVQRGQLVNVSGSGFAPGAVITVKLGNDPVATVIADSSGSFSVNVTIPSTQGPGAYVIQAIGRGADGILHVDSTPLSVMKRSWLILRCSDIWPAW